MARSTKRSDNFGFISARSLIAENVLIAPNAHIYGRVIIGLGVILEPNVTIGHPSPQEQTQLRTSIKTSKLPDGQTYDDLLDSFVLSETIIEEGTIIRSGTSVYSGTHIAKNGDIAHNCLIREDCDIGRDTQVITGAQIMASVKIGNGCRIAGTLANRTTVGTGSSMLGHAMHRFKIGVSGHIEFAPKIGKGVVIGRESAIVGGVEIGDYSIVGAGAVITKPVPEKTIWIGNPAKQVGVRHLEEYQELVRKVESYED